MVKYEKFMRKYVPNKHTGKSVNIPVTKHRSVDLLFLVILILEVLTSALITQVYRQNILH